MAARTTNTQVVLDQGDLSALVAAIQQGFDQINERLDAIVGKPVVAIPTGVRLKDVATRPPRKAVAK